MNKTVKTEIFTTNTQGFHSSKMELIQDHTFWWISLQTKRGNDSHTFGPHEIQRKIPL